MCYSEMSLLEPFITIGPGNLKSESLSTFTLTKEFILIFNWMGFQIYCYSWKNSTKGSWIFITKGPPIFWFSLSFTFFLCHPCVFLFLSFSVSISFSTFLCLSVFICQSPMFLSVYLSIQSPICIHT